jgi:hypothetical protein
MKSCEKKIITWKRERKQREDKNEKEIEKQNKNMRNRATQSETGEKIQG